jgi:dienelactone hydrolase
MTKQFLMASVVGLAVSTSASAAIVAGWTMNTAVPAATTGTNYTYGAADTGIPLDTVDKMKTALAAGSPAARASEFHVYAEAPHAFHADYRPSYRKPAADDGWQRCLGWMRKHGVA